MLYTATFRAGFFPHLYIHVCVCVCVCMQKKKRKNASRCATASFHFPLLFSIFHFFLGKKCLQVRNCNLPGRGVQAPVSLPLACFENGYLCSLAKDCDSCIDNGCGWCAGQEYEGKAGGGMSVCMCICTYMYIHVYVYKYLYTYREVPAWRATCGGHCAATAGPIARAPGK